MRTRVVTVQNMKKEMSLQYDQLDKVYKSNGNCLLKVKLSLQTQIDEKSLNCPYKSILSPLDMIETSTTT